jgi:hypothetical protein
MAKPIVDWRKSPAVKAATAALRRHREAQQAGAKLALDTTDDRRTAETACNSVMRRISQGEQVGRLLAVRTAELDAARDEELHALSMTAELAEMSSTLEADVIRAVDAAREARGQEVMSRHHEAFTAALPLARKLLPLLDEMVMARGAEREMFASDSLDELGRRPDGLTLEPSPHSKITTLLREWFDRVDTAPGFRRSA